MKDGLAATEKHRKSAIGLIKKLFTYRLFLFKTNNITDKKVPYQNTDSS